MLLGTPTLSFIRLSSLMYPDEKFALLMLHVHRLAPARGKDVHKAAGRLRQSNCALGRSEERRVGKEWSVRVDLGGRRIIKKKSTILNPYCLTIYTNSLCFSNLFMSIQHITISYI